MQLPINCNAQYIENFISVEESLAIFTWIYNHANVLNGEDIVMADGSIFHLSEGKCMFVDAELNNGCLFPDVHGRRQVWPAVLLPLKNKLEQITGVTFSVCVAIYYRDGNENIGFHYDAPAFGPTDLIASISIGQPRAFIFRNKYNYSDLFSLKLADGSLLLMGEGCQENYEHCLPVINTQINPRINLTFRQFDWPA